MAFKSDDNIPLNEVNARLDREHIHLALLYEAARGLEDVRDGRVEPARKMLARYRVARRK
ncbi:MAG: hypothetical protein FIB05_03880 [Betaproteobacteria bacterium]|nr:hypothetical protein [Betaproteobacteria bacterium]